MKAVKAPPGKLAHVRRDINGRFRHCGGTEANPQNGDTVEWFDTVAEAEAAPGVQMAKRAEASEIELCKLEPLKSQLAYAAKASAVERFLDSGLDQPHPVRHRMLVQEMELRGWSAQEACEQILAAADRVRLAEGERVAKVLEIKRRFDEG